ncbi:MAG: CDP-2,3-bis-(O-geranylgeranyl)-sn-glycerol synthase [Candidatus Nanoarchaeia archaeon]
MGIISLIIDAIWFILPAYFANAAPVVFAKILRHRNLPMDFGIKIKGKFIFGPGKTWGGFFGGLLTGTIIGIFQGRILEGFLLSVGALCGDLFGSFIKRRLNLPRGTSIPILDQLGFVIFALLFVSFATKILFEILVIILLMTPLLHLGMNVLAYLLKLKKEWY